MDFDFGGKVAVVTGAGSGIGRSHALMLAKRGARLVVNDLGSKVTGDSKSSEAADKVVDEIIAEGGEAIAEYSDVSSETEANKIIETAISKWGRVDVLINNAGILRDKSFSKITMEDYRKVIDVHLMGSVYCTHAAWPYMRQQNYGRVIFTTSVAGLYGNFGQSNYSAAKMSLVGLTKTLKQEGAKYNIRVNAIAPLAATRMGEDVFANYDKKMIPTDSVSALATYLADENNSLNGEVISICGNRVALVKVTESTGYYFTGNENIAPEDIANNLGAITNMSDTVDFDDCLQAIDYCINNKTAS